MFDFIKRMFGAEPEVKVENQDQEHNEQDQLNDKYRQGAPSDSNDGDGES
ncbi:MULTISPECIES: hypothetical protein [Photobacterium]|nr:hypothetical protein [Photobacterium sp. S4TG1]